MRRVIGTAGALVMVSVVAASVGKPVSCRSAKPWSVHCNSEAMNKLTETESAAWV